MDKNTTWIGEQHLSIERCKIISKENSYHVKGELVGNKNNQVYGVDYQIVVDENWETRFFSIETRTGHKNNFINAHKINGLWMIDEMDRPEFNECLDIDIAITPFTNTIPINRLKLAVNATAEITVIYIDPIDGRLVPMLQQYTRLSDSRYFYKNLGTEFESEIEVDENGIVLNYPGLFKAII
ncbi:MULTISPECIES: putative glycolipid-binding domain-containing protein [Myroides]|uniref:Uncharacterized protein n=1 Tax=Myroides albus TaxID=2562892 RepID=A0A6I3LS09_9FLAO|nr:MULTISPECIES: putative glycolipid-binding domain-containing protein [Myroides]MTG98882.1 hypothetical protein [Myroides albus]MVX34922.1 hypothetical protein [Myroides sp. LoEW2-1]UVD79560.1 putative glycolipid-binding domain-containing protein [Myroides albus]